MIGLLRFYLGSIDANDRLLKTLYHLQAFTVRSTFAFLQVKNMLKSMAVVCTRFKNHIDKNIESFGNGVNFHLLAQQYTLENFALNGLTINANAFDAINNDFTKIAFRILTVDDAQTMISNFLMVIDPKLAYIFRQK